MVSVRRVGFAFLAVLAAVAYQPLPAFAQRVVRASTEGVPDTDAPRATMTCEHVTAAGRVRCEVEARVAQGHSISWGEVVLRRVPPFAAALRGRVGPHDAAVREPGLWRWPFALVARGKGAGQVEGQVRVVVCRDTSCASRDLSVTGMLEVGP